jgi:hypothetical protein
VASETSGLSPERLPGRRFRFGPSPDRSGSHSDGLCGSVEAAGSWKQPFRRPGFGEYEARLSMGETSSAAWSVGWSTSTSSPGQLEPPGSADAGPLADPRAARRPSNARQTAAPASSPAGPSQRREAAWPRNRYSGSPCRPSLTPRVSIASRSGNVNPTHGHASLLRSRHLRSAGQ